MSLWREPNIRVPANPLPISKPFDAGMESIALPKSASNLSKTGLPSPAGSPSILHRITPPTESPPLRAFLTSSIILSAVGLCGQRIGVASISASVGVWTMAGIEIRFTLSTHAVIFTPSPKKRFKIFFAIAPAATRPIVSRAELLPPPRGSRKPNLAS